MIGNIISGVTNVVAKVSDNIKQKRQIKKEINTAQLGFLKEKMTTVVFTCAAFTFIIPVGFWILSPIFKYLPGFTGILSDYESIINTIGMERIFYIVTSLLGVGGITKVVGNIGNISMAKKKEETKQKVKEIKKEVEIQKIKSNIIDTDGDGLDDRGMDQLKVHEGLKLKPYKCTANKTTIGYGRNLEDRGITKKEAEYMFSNDVKEFKQRLFSEIPWIEKLDLPRQWVLINMAFNLGIAGLLKWKNTLSHIEKGHYRLASKEMLKSRWAKQVKSRANQLSEQMKSGEWL